MAVHSARTSITLSRTFDSGPFAVFLTHDWGEDELKRDNHVRVSRINDALKARGRCCSLAAATERQTRISYSNAPLLPGSTNQAHTLPTQEAVCNPTLTAAGDTIPLPLGW